ncbi:MAG: mandelate racemase/muconate lactonizing enzyme family protein [Lentisphaeria bacterium]|nr:hypothetical protein [Lentisphaeria bacterium]NQZ71157.1 mandelate racemase/muconate lactonizing enzyme family protein [Lentisphaeria bacterium]
MNNNDITISDAALYFMPVTTRMPYKFGNTVMDKVTTCRVVVNVSSEDGRSASGWGETPLSAGWAWPAQTDLQTCEARMKTFCIVLTKAFRQLNDLGHPLELGQQFIENDLKTLLDEFNANAQSTMPYLAALVCYSALDIAMHDAYGLLHQIPVYRSYTAQYMNKDLSAYLSPEPGFEGCFDAKYPCDFLVDERPDDLPVWHAIGGADPLDEDDLTGDEPDDGFPVILADWIQRDGIDCLKIKLSGTGFDYDYQRIVKISQIGKDNGAHWTCTDFNCTVEDPQYVNDILDKLQQEHPELYDMILYVEQPFPYELSEFMVDVHSVSERKPLFMDESAHDWTHVRTGRQLGWTGVALKTCKSQSGAILSACWAKAHGMDLMVQDLTNPMLAQIPHVLLAAHTGTIMGLESNAPQFYPNASDCEAKVHPGLYLRRYGKVNLSSLDGNGFGYRIDEIVRSLPEATVAFQG